MFGWPQEGFSKNGHYFLTLFYYYIIFAKILHLRLLYQLLRHHRMLWEENFLSPPTEAELDILLRGFYYWVVVI